MPPILLCPFPCSSPLLILPLNRKPITRTTQGISSSLKASPALGIHSTTNALDATTSVTSCAASDSSDEIQDIPVLSLFRAYARIGRMREARALFDAMPRRTLVTWTILMSGYVAHGPGIEALFLFCEMLRQPSAISRRPDPFVFAVLLRACAAIGRIDHGREFHCSVLKLGYLQDLFVVNALLTMYASCGSLRHSEDVFRGIRQPDLVSWSSMLSGYVMNGHDEEALRLLGEMASAEVVFDAYALSIGLKASGNLGCVRFGLQIHCSLIKMGFNSCLHLGNSLIEFYGRNGELRSMRQVFDVMLRKDLVSWNTIIACYAQNPFSGEALRLFRYLMVEGFPCDEFTLGSVLHASASLGALSHGKEIHGYMIRAAYDSDRHAVSALLDMYIKCIEHETSDYDRDKIPFKLVKHFLSTGAELDEFIIASILKSCASQLDLEAGKMFHACSLKLGMKSDPYVTSSLIDMYAKCGILEASLMVFARFDDPGTVLWSAIIAGHSWNGQFQEALQLLRRMQLAYVQANDFTYTSTILACIALRDLRVGKQIHSNIIKDGYGSTASVVNALIDLYCELQQLQDALKLCSSISDRNISWGPLIQYFARLENHERIFNLFHKIQRSNGQLDHVSACNILKSCERPVLLNSGTQVHAYIIKRGLVSDPKMGNSLIKMYSRCGTIALAFDAFNQMRKKNSASWTLMISANVDNGFPCKALELFTLMLRKDKQPNSGTFLSVLKACAQMGLVDEAFRIFISMSQVYKISPSSEHYSCVVEALGHAGMFREAEHFLDHAIPYELGASTWKALLSSGQLHGNMKVAKHAAEKLIELEPTNVMANVLLQQALLASGRWHDASKLMNRTSRQTLAG